MKTSGYEKRSKFVIHQLVKAREEAELTQKMVADTGIVSQSELSKIENGQRQIDFLTLVDLAKLYNKDLSIFILR